MKRHLYEYLAVRVFAVILLCVLLPFIFLLFSVNNSMAKVINGEISSRAYQTFYASSEEINKLFTKMLMISTYIVNDEELIDSFKDPDMTYYDRTRIFQRILSQIYSLDLFEYEVTYQQNDLGIKIILSDSSGHIYSSWGNMKGINIQNLLDSDIVKKAREKKGYIFWSMNAPALSFSENMEKPQLALARAFYNVDYYQDDYGFIIITVNQQKLFSILEQYKNSDDDYLFAVLNDEIFVLNQNRERIEIPLSALSRANSLEPIHINGKSYLLNKYSIDSIFSFGTEKMDLYCLTDYSHILHQIQRQTAKINYTAAFSAIAIVVIALWISWAIARPVNRLTNHIKKNTPGTKPVAIKTGRKDEIGLIYQAYNRLADQNYHLFERLQEEQKIREKYYLESLKSKVSPHFLFNTLNSIRWMAVIRNAVNIQQSVDALASILKYSLSNDSEFVSLSQELKIVEDYCYIQETRFGRSCVLQEEVPEECADIKVIKFILQPVVENCFKHAFTGDSSNLIRIRAWIREDKLWVSIGDSGKGFPEQMIRRFRHSDCEMEQDNHLGLHTVDERIRIAYGDSYGLSLNNLPDGGACVLYCLPVDTEEKNENNSIG